LYPKTTSRLSVLQFAVLQWRVSDLNCTSIFGWV